MIKMTIRICQSGMRRMCHGLRIDPNCSWCGGSGMWTDPAGKRWPCIQCNR